MIATVGEALVDMIEQSDGNFEPCLGGSVCNFTLGLGRQGVQATYLCPLSTDIFGEQFHALLLSNGVELNPKSRSSLPTSLAIVHLDEKGSPSYTFYRDSVADRDADMHQLITSFPSDLEVLHTGGLALVPDDMPKILATVDAAKHRGAVISIDANLRPLLVKDTRAYATGVDVLLRQAHIIKVSDEDALILGLDTVNAATLAEHFFTDDSSVHLIAFTRGAKGAVLMTRSITIDLPAPAPQKIVDTVGAGDCFHAGLIAYLSKAGVLKAQAGLSALTEDLLRKSLRHALASATWDIMQSGCNPGTWDQIESVAS
jgi:fructokinase